MRNIISSRIKDTQALAADVAKQIANNSKQHNTACVIALTGDLGSGKTVFAKSFAKALGIKENITSPTFVLLKKYKHFVHIDAYRLQHEKDLENLGIHDLMKDPRNIILIEWADRVPTFLPKHSIKIHLDHLAETKRNIKITGI